MDNFDENILLIDESDYPILIEEECAELKPVIEDFMRSYSENKDKPVRDWIIPKMSQYLPDKTTEEIENMTNEIISSLETAEEKKASLSEATSNGRSKESWFAADVKKALSAKSASDTANYLNQLDRAVNQANEALYETIKTNAGNISNNPNLDGYIAEQYHAQTFNLNAEASGSQYRAEVVKPQGKRYAKNSVDIVIKDPEGKIVKRYQSKYAKNAKATEKAFKKGDYRGQGKLVPEGQSGDIKHSSDVITAPDGTTSNPLAKNKAEKLRDDARSGKWNDLDWNDYKTKDLAVGIGKQTAAAAVQGMAISVGMDIAQKLWNGEEVKADEVIKDAVVSGADFGVKAAAASSLKVGVEKGIVTVIPKGTPASTISNIVFVAVEDVKVLGKIVSGDLTVREGIEQISQTTVSTAAGMISMAKGAAIGTQLGIVLGPIGMAVGYFIGGSVGYIAGSSIGKAVVNGAKKVCGVVKNTIKKAASKIADVGRSIADGISNIGSKIASIFW